MSSQPRNTSEVRADQVASKKYQTLKLGLDVHADTIVVVRILDHGAPQPAQKFTPAKFLTWVKTQLALAEAVHSCNEASPFGYGLHRDLLKLRIQNVVVAPVCLDEHHKGVNHDKSDARELALRLDRYVAGNPKALATVRVPTPRPAHDPRLPRKESLVGTEALGEVARQAARLAGRAAGSLPPPAGLPDHRVGCRMQRFVELGFPDALIARLPPGGPRLRLSA